MTITSHERVTAALMRVGGIRGLIECVRNTRMNASARTACVQAFDALAEAVAAAEKDGFRRGQEVMREAVAIHEWQWSRNRGVTVDGSNANAARIRALPILDDPPEAEKGGPGAAN